MTDINTRDGAILEALNNKTDIDFNNAAPAVTFRSRAAEWSMPSGNFIDLSLGATGSTYTAPATGWYYILKGITAGQYFIFTNETKGYSMNIAPSSTNGVRYIFPVTKGDVVSVSYTASGTLVNFRFFYAEGEI